MLQKYKTKREEGFTIIEVLIVLAIAGLIILIVFLAVPALQRNSRNTQRKNDAAAIASAAQNVVNNTNGNLPNQVSSGDGATADENVVSIGWEKSSGNVVAETAKLGLYRSGATASWGTQAGGIFIVANPTSVPTVNPGAVRSESATSVSRESVTIVTGYKCDTSNTGLDSARSPRSISIIYVVEAANGNGAIQCTS